MFLFAVFFCCGIAIAKYIYLPIFPLFAISVVLAILARVFLEHKFSKVIIIFLIIALGSMLFISRRILPNDHIARITPYDSKEAVLTGIVSNYPQPKASYTDFILEAQQLVMDSNSYKLRGKVLVKMYKEDEIVYGQRLLLKGNISKPYTYGRSKYYREYLRRQGIYSVFTVNKQHKIEILELRKGNVFRMFIFKLRRKANAALFKNIPFTQAALLSAMILGDRSNIPANLNKMFIQTGTVHMLAISGFNVGIVAAILELIMRVFRVRRKARYAILVLALVFYCVLTGACAPVVRSTIMAVVLITAFFLKREVNIADSLSLAAMIILVINPAQLFDIGFQLSFLSILAIAYIAPFIKKLMRYEKYKSRAFRLLLDLFSSSTAAFLGLLPFILYYFKIVSPVSILANILVVPYVSLVTVLGLTYLIIGALLPCAAVVFALPASLSVVILFVIVKFFNSIPFGYFYLR